MASLVDQTKVEQDNKGFGRVGEFMDKRGLGNIGWEVRGIEENKERKTIRKMSKKVLQEWLSMNCASCIHTFV